MAGVAQKSWALMRPAARPSRWLRPWANTAGPAARLSATTTEADIG